MSGRRGFNSLVVARNASDCFRSSSSFGTRFSLLGRGVQRFFGLGGVGFLFNSKADDNTVPAVSKLFGRLGFSRRGRVTRGARFRHVMGGINRGLRTALRIVCSTHACCSNVRASNRRIRRFGRLCSELVRQVRRCVFGDVGISVSGRASGGILRRCEAFCRGVTLHGGSLSHVHVFAAGGSLFGRATLSSLGVRCVGNFNKKLEGCFGPTLFGCA